MEQQNGHLVPGVVSKSLTATSAIATTITITTAAAPPGAIRTHTLLTLTLLSLKWDPAVIHFPRSITRRAGWCAQCWIESLRPSTMIVRLWLDTAVVLARDMHLRHFIGVEVHIRHLSEANRFEAYFYTEIDAAPGDGCTPDRARVAEAAGGVEDGVRIEVAVRAVDNSIGGIRQFRTRTSRRIVQGLCEIV